MPARHPAIFESMPLVSGLSHIGIRVRDCDTAVHFYELLGFRFVVRHTDGDDVAILHHPSGLELNLIVNATSSVNVLMDSGEKHPGYTHMALWVDDLEQARTRLDAAGFPLSGGPVTFPNGVRAIFVRDPDRNVVELDESPKKLR